MEEEIKVCSCCPDEDDWLDVSYSQRHYIQEENSAFDSVRPAKRRKERKPFYKIAAYVMACVLVVGIIFAMKYANKGFAGEVFSVAKAAGNSGILQVFKKSDKGEVINLPINVTVDKVENGTVTISGGKVLLSFCNGEVSDVTDDTVTVKTSDDLQIVYGGLTKILVKKGDKIATQTVIGKYVTTAAVNLLYKGEVVKDITTVNYTLVWKV